MALTSTAYVVKHYTLSAANLKTSGQNATAIVPAVSGKKFYLTSAYAICVTRTAITVDPSFQIEGEIGGEGGGYSPLATINGGSVVFASADSLIDFTKADPLKAAAIGTNGVKLNVTTPATGTTLTADIVVAGYHR